LTFEELKNPNITRPVIFFPIMKFIVLSETDSFPFHAKADWIDCMVLHSSDWDDWFTWSTQYYLQYFDSNGVEHDIGSVKIASTEMKDARRADLPGMFTKLDSEFFSVGQSENYYENLNKLGPAFREEVLNSLQDVASTPQRIDELTKLSVFSSSLLRSVSLDILKGRFTRLARGDSRLTKYKFSYSPPESFDDADVETNLTFAVAPHSEPPTNIHVFVGRNGVGKTRYLKLIQMALIHDNGPVVGLLTADSDNEDRGLFANLISVSFSAFDQFDDLPVPPSSFDGVSFSYIGLKKADDLEKGRWSTSPKTVFELTAEFVASLRSIRKSGALERWSEAIDILQSDPVFKETDIASLADKTFSDSTEWASAANAVFLRLSSGHKIVLLTVTRLVEDVAERTLVLIDEPESHLHPPLLSAFVRSLSDLLIKRNGVAIVATHSPVVLQEVPKSCVWKLWRIGTTTTAERPEIETFGENVGVLTREVFGLEVTQSGFHKMVSEAAYQTGDYEEVIAKFGGQLGGEARTIARSQTTKREN
jgi:ABC-type cobalamin/Fe3+-siderophores transport system ATPase subunit